MRRRAPAAWFWLTVAACTSMDASECRTVVLRLEYGGPHAELVPTLPMGIAAAAPATDVVELALAYAAALRTPGAGAAGKRVIVAAGPQLDSPDDVRIRECRVEVGRVFVRAEYTSVRLRGGQLRRNIPFRPLIRIDEDLKPGRYRVEAHWQAVTSMAEGKAAAAPLIAGPVTVTIP